MPLYKAHPIDDTIKELAESILNQDNNKKYKFYICIGNYPDIDPNVKHNYYDITSSYQEAVKLSTHQREIMDRDKVHEIIDRFGMLIDAYIEDFDYDKIKVEHCLKKKPCLVHKNSRYHTFTDGSSDAIIETSKIAEYKHKVFDEYIVYQRKYIAELEDPHYDLNVFLTESFRERGATLNCINILLLSLEQIKVIEGMCKVELLKYYNEEEPNIFVVKSLSC